MKSFTEGSIIMDYGLLFGLKLKHLNDGFVFYKHASFQFTMR